MDGMIIAALLPLPGLSACTTTRAASAEERAHCAAMAGQMGTRAPRRERRRWSSR